MSKSRIDLLRKPEKKHDLRLIMPPSECPVRSKQAGRPIIVGFETVEAARAEDSKRVKLARACLEQRQPVPRAATKRLIRALSYGCGRPPQTRASSAASRTHRIKIAGAVLDLLEREAALPVKAFTLLSRKWMIPSDEMTAERLLKLKKTIRNDIDRLETVEGPGFVIAGFDGEYDEALDTYFVHLHGVLGGAYIKAFQRELRDRPKFRPCPFVLRPLRIADLADPPRQVSYIIKSFWGATNSEQPRSESKMAPRRMRRMPEPYSTIYLTALNELDPSGAMIVAGLELREGRYYLRKQ